MVNFDFADFELVGLLVVAVLTDLPFLYLVGWGVGEESPRIMGMEAKATTLPPDSATRTAS